MGKYICERFTGDNVSFPYPTPTEGEEVRKQWKHSESIRMHWKAVAIYLQC